MLPTPTANVAEGAASPSNRAVLLNKRPSGVLSNEDIQVVDLPKPTEIKDKQILVRNLYASIDPTQRIWASDEPQYLAPTPLDAPIRAATIGIVEVSRDPDIPVGSHVTGIGNLQSYYVTSAADGASVVPPDDELPLTAHLSVLSSIIGLAAWAGVNEILKPEKGETFVVSGGSGAVGSLAGQLAKMRGARVIGIVGSEEKARWLTETVGYDAAVIYKTDEATLVQRLREAAPDGIDAYFDNTGGTSTEAVLQVVNNNARIALCGVISEYNSGKIGLRSYQMLLHRRVNLKGFICFDYIAKYPHAKEELTKLVKAKKLVYREDIQEGLENYVAVLNRLFDGSNTGKLILKI